MKLVIISIIQMIAIRSNETKIGIIASVIAYKGPPKYVVFNKVLTS
jgi:hypothetical protein